MQTLRSCGAVRYRGRTGLISASCLAVLSAVGWAGCESADGGEDDPPLSESWGPTSEWPAFDPDRPKPSKPGNEHGGNGKPPTSVGGGADRDDDDELSSESPRDQGQVPGPAPGEGPRMPIFDAGAATPRLDAGRPSKPSSPSDAGPETCTAPDGGADTCSADGGTTTSD